MLILDRYVLRDFVKWYVSCLCMFVFLYMLVDVFSALQDIVKNHPPLLKVAEYYIYSCPLIVTQTSPIAALLATLLALGGFNQSNEIIAMRAHGLSVFAIVRPLVTFGILVCLGIFVLGETVTPAAQRMSKSIRSYYIDKTAETEKSKSIQNIAVYGFNNRLFFIDKLYPATSTIEGLTILEHDAQQNVKTKVYAEKAVWRNNRWVLYQCFIYHIADNDKIRGEPLYFNDTTFKIEETPMDFLRQNIPVENMNMRELSGYLARLYQTREKATIRRLQVDLYQKMSLPFTSLIVILLGIPSSVIIRRRAIAFSSIGLCVGIGFIFYVAFAVSIALGKGGALPPIVAAWISHAIFGATALYFISRIP